MSTRITLFTGLLAFASVALFQAADAQAAKEKFERTKPHANVSTIGPIELDLRGFTQLSGLGVEVEVVETEDPSSGVIRKKPGRTTYANITLKRGYFGPTNVEVWATDGLRGEIPLIDFRVDIVTPSAEPVSRIDLFECFPTRWELGTNEKGEVQETLTIACDRIELK